MDLKQMIGVRIGEIRKQKGRTQEELSARMRAVRFRGKNIPLVTGTLHPAIDTLLDIRYMFMKPAVTQYAADVFAFELHYRPQVNWQSYESLLKFSTYVFNELSKIDDYLKARDKIDVQSFIWCSEH